MINYRSILTIFLVIVYPSVGMACFCASLGITTEYRKADAVFIGRLQGKKETDFYFSGRFPIPLSLFHFEVLKISKGLSPYDNLITIIDHYHDSTCGGLFYEQAVGDTILVFARTTSLMTHLEMLSSSHCTGNLVVNDLSQHDSLEIIEQFPWDTTILNEAVYYHLQEKEAVSREAQPDPANDVPPILDFALAGSILINLFFIGWRIRDRLKSS